MRVLTLSHLGKIPEEAAYISALKKVGSVDSLLLTMGREEYELGRKIAVFDEVKDILPKQSELDAADKDPSIAARSLKELEGRIGCCFVNKDILMDRFFRGQPFREINPHTVPLTWNGSRTKQFMYYFYRRFDQEMEEFNPDFVFVETYSAPTRMAWRLARQRGVPAGGFMPVRFWPERLYLETGIGYDWHQVRLAYREMAGRPMEGAELATVKRRLQTIVEQKTKPAYMQSEHSRGSPTFLKKLFQMRLVAGLYPWLGSRAKSFRRNPQVLPGKVLSPIAKYFRYWNGQVGKRYLLEHQTPLGKIQSKKYAIYFLHVSPELTVEGIAFDYQDQVNTLRNILAALPADTDLIIKEHSPMLGYRPMEFYSELVHMPGIIIADTNEDSHKLIAQASVVVTLTGTVALEAVLYGVPAIVLGSIYFDSFNGVYNPENLNELGRLMADPEQLRGATEDDALRALGSMLRASECGSPARVDVMLQDIDAESAKVMFSELKKICNKSG